MKNFQLFGIIFITALVSQVAGAATVRLDGVSADPLLPTLITGSEISFDLVAVDFPDTISGDFTIDLGTVGVLGLEAGVPSPSFVKAAIWDTSNAIAPFNSHDVLIGVGSGGANPTGDFDIGTITFDIIGAPGDSTSIMFADFTGFSAASDLSIIDVTYDIGYVKVVPVPAAFWLLLGGIGFLAGIARKIRA